MFKSADLSEVQQLKMLENQYTATQCNGISKSVLGIGIARGQYH